MQIVVNKNAIDCVLYQLSLKNRPAFDEVVFIKLLQNVNQMWFTKFFVIVQTTMIFNKKNVQIFIWGLLHLFFGHETSAGILCHEYFTDNILSSESSL